MSTFDSFLGLAEVRASGIHDAGVFARTRIPKGTIWWRIVPTDAIHIPRTAWELLMASHRSPRIEAILHFSYYDEDEDALVLLADDSRHINHSFSPNSEFLVGELMAVTTRDIEAGEEIVEDYTRYGKCPWAQLYGEFGRLIGV